MTFKQDWKGASKSERIKWSLELLLELVFMIGAVVTAIMFRQSIDDSATDWKLLTLTCLLMVEGIIMARLPWRDKPLKPANGGKPPCQ